MRSHEEIRKLSVKDVSLEASKVRNAFCKKLWLKKETRQVT